jgi:hypothetical protein
MADDDDVTEPPEGFWGDDEGEYDEPAGEPQDPRTVPLAAERYDDDPDYDDADYDDDRPQRRAALLVVLAALVFVLAGVAVAAALVSSNDDDGDSNASVTSSSTSTTRSTAPSISGLPGQGSSSSSSSTSTTKVGTSSTSSSTSSSTTSTTEAADGPACSPTASSPAAADNKPMKVAFCLDDPTPKVGQVVTLSGTAEDLDGGTSLDCIKFSWEGEQFGECVPPQEDPPLSINESYTQKHTFTKAGTYTIHVGARSGKPKDSFAEATLKITVHA